MTWLNSDSLPWPALLLLAFAIVGYWYFRTAVHARGLQESKEIVKETPPEYRADVAESLALMDATDSDSVSSDAVTALRDKVRHRGPPSA